MAKEIANKQKKCVQYDNLNSPHHLGCLCFFGFNHTFFLRLRCCTIRTRFTLHLGKAEGGLLGGISLTKCRCFPSENWHLLSSLQKTQGTSDTVTGDAVQCCSHVHAIHQRELLLNGNLAPFKGQFGWSKMHKNKSGYLVFTFYILLCFIPGNPGQKRVGSMVENSASSALWVNSLRKAGSQIGVSWAWKWLLNMWGISQNPRKKN